MGLSAREDRFLPPGTCFRTSPFIRRRLRPSIEPPAPDEDDGPVETGLIGDESEADTRARETADRIAREENQRRNEARLQAEAAARQREEARRQAEIRATQPPWDDGDDLYLQFGGGGLENPYHPGNLATVHTVDGRVVESSTSRDGEVTYNFADGSRETFQRDDSGNVVRADGSAPARESFSGSRRLVPDISGAADPDATATAGEDPQTDPLDSGDPADSDNLDLDAGNVNLAAEEGTDSSANGTPASASEAPVAPTAFTGRVNVVTDGGSNPIEYANEQVSESDAAAEEVEAAHNEALLAYVPDDAEWSRGKGDVEKGREAHLKPYENDWIIRFDFDGGDEGPAVTFKMPAGTSTAHAYKMLFDGEVSNISEKGSSLASAVEAIKTKQAGGGQVFDDSPEWQSYLENKAEYDKALTRAQYRLDEVFSGSDAGEKEILGKINAIVGKVQGSGLSEAYAKWEKEHGEAEAALEAAEGWQQPLTSTAQPSDPGVGYTMSEGVAPATHRLVDTPEGLPSLVVPINPGSQPETGVGYDRSEGPSFAPAETVDRGNVAAFLSDFGYQRNPAEGNFVSTQPVEDAPREPTGSQRPNAALMAGFYGNLEQFSDEYQSLRSELESREATGGLFGLNTVLENARGFVGPQGEAPAGGAGLTDVADPSGASAKFGLSRPPFEGDEALANTESAAGISDSDREAITALLQGSGVSYAQFASLMDQLHTPDPEQRDGAFFDRDTGRPAASYSSYLERREARDRLQELGVLPDEGIIARWGSGASPVATPPQETPPQDEETPLESREATGRHFGLDRVLENARGFVGPDREESGPGVYGDITAAATIAPESASYGDDLSVDPAPAPVSLESLAAAIDADDRADTEERRGVTVGVGFGGPDVATPVSLSELRGQTVYINNVPVQFDDLVDRRVRGAARTPVQVRERQNRAEQEALEYVREGLDQGGVRLIPRETPGAQTLTRETLGEAFYLDGIPQNTEQYLERFGTSNVGRTPAQRAASNAEAEAQAFATLQQAQSEGRLTTTAPGPGYYPPLPAGGRTPEQGPGLNPFEFVPGGSALIAHSRVTDDLSPGGQAPTLDEGRYQTQAGLLTIGDLALTALPVGAAARGLRGAYGSITDIGGNVVSAGQRDFKLRSLHGVLRDSPDATRNLQKVRDLEQGGVDKLNAYEAVAKAEGLLPDDYVRRFGLQTARARFEPNVGEGVYGSGMAPGALPGGRINYDPGPYGYTRTGLEGQIPELSPASGQLTQQFGRAYTNPYVVGDTAQPIGGGAIQGGIGPASIRDNPFATPTYEVPPRTFREAEGTASPSAAMQRQPWMDPLDETTTGITPDSYSLGLRGRLDDPQPGGGTGIAPEVQASPAVAPPGQTAPYTATGGPAPTASLFRSADVPMVQTPSGLYVPASAISPALAQPVGVPSAEALPDLSVQPATAVSQQTAGDVETRQATQLGTGLATGVETSTAAQTDTAAQTEVAPGLRTDTSQQIQSAAQVELTHGVRIDPVTGRPELPQTRIDPVTGTPELPQTIIRINPLTGTPELPWTRPITGTPELPWTEPRTGTPELPYASTVNLPDLNTAPAPFGATGLEQAPDATPDQRTHTPPEIDIPGPRDDPGDPLLPPPGVPRIPPREEVIRRPLGRRVEQPVPQDAHPVESGRPLREDEFPARWPTRRWCSTFPRTTAAWTACWWRWPTPGSPRPTPRRRRRASTSPATSASRPAARASTARASTPSCRPGTRQSGIRRARRRRRCSSPTWTPARPRCTGSGNPGGPARALSSSWTGCPKRKPR